MNFAQFKNLLGLSNLTVTDISGAQGKSFDLARYLTQHLVDSAKKSFFEYLPAINGTNKVIFGGDDHFAFWFDPYQAAGVSTIWFAGDCPTACMEEEVSKIYEFSFDNSIDVSQRPTTMSGIVEMTTKTELMAAMSLVMRSIPDFAECIATHGRPTVDVIGRDAAQAVRDSRLAKQREQINGRSGNSPVSNLLKAMELMSRPQMETSADEDLDGLVGLIISLIINAPLQVVEDVVKSMGGEGGLPKGVVDLCNGLLSVRRRGDSVDLNVATRDMKKAFEKSMDEIIGGADIVVPEPYQNAEETESVIQAIKDANIPGLKIIEDEDQTSLPAGLRSLIGAAHGYGVEIKALRLDMSEVPPEEVESAMQRINELLNAGAKKKD